MLYKNFRYIFPLLILCYCQTTFAQEKPKKADDKQVYQDIERYSKKNKFTKFMHHLLFEPITEQKVKQNTFQYPDIPACRQLSLAFLGQK